MRFYGFRAEEIADEQSPGWISTSTQAGLGFAESRVFPVDVNRADYEALLRVPGIGVSRPG